MNCVRRLRSGYQPVASPLRWFRRPQHRPTKRRQTTGPLDQKRMGSLRRMAQGNDPEFLVRLIAGFREATPVCFAEIEAAIDGW